MSTTASSTTKHRDENGVLLRVEFNGGFYGPRRNRWGFSRSLGGPLAGIMVFGELPKAVQTAWEEEHPK
jgi:hypothetical protein